MAVNLTGILLYYKWFSAEKMLLVNLFYQNYT